MEETERKKDMEAFSELIEGLAESVTSFGIPDDIATMIATVEVCALVLCIIMFVPVFVLKMKKRIKKVWKIPDKCLIGLAEIYAIAFIIFTLFFMVGLFSDIVNDEVLGLGITGLIVPVILYVIAIALFIFCLWALFSVAIKGDISANGVGMGSLLAVYDLASSLAWVSLAITLLAVVAMVVIAVFLLSIAVSGDKKRVVINGKTYIEEDD